MYSQLITNVKLQMIMIIKTVAYILYLRETNQSMQDWEVMRYL